MRVESITDRLPEFLLHNYDRGRIQRFGYSILAVFLATCLRFLFDPVLGETVPWIFFYPAVLLAAWAGGFGAGIFACLLSIVIALFFWIEPRFSLQIPDAATWAIVIIFGTSSVFISLLAEIWHRAISAQTKIQKELTNQKQALARANEQLEQQARELELRVQERTAKLQETVAELEAFSYTVSHDLRAPLRAMLNLTHFVLEDYGKQLDGKGIDYLERIRNAATRMDSLINDVLYYSRTTRAETGIEEIDLNGLFDAVIEEYPNIKMPHAKITIERPLLSVRANYALLVQCVSNLLGNAVKFVGAGEQAKILVCTEKIDSRVRLNIQDNGIGIPKDLESKIFELFQRAHSEFGYEGTGIGLAIVKKAVEKMNGKIGVESKVGKGSRFWIELPAAINQVFKTETTPVSAS